MKLLQLSGAVFICLNLLIGCASQRTPVVWDAERIPTYAGFVRLHDKEGKTYGQVSTDRVRNVLDATRRIEGVAGVTVRVAIIEGDTPNAFAWHREGHSWIGFTLGMIDLIGSDRDAYAAVIGHEIAHVVLNHGDTRKEREQTRSAATQVLGQVLGAVGVPLGGVVADIATKAVSTAFTRDEERDADKYGVDYARRAGFDPRGAVRIWEKMASRSSGMTIPFLSTHPLPEERIDTLRQIALASPQPEPALTSGRSTSVAPSPPQPAGPPLNAKIVAMSRLRPIGALSNVSFLPAGDLYVDMASITAVPTTDLKRVWLIINKQFGGGSSVKAYATVNCVSRSILIVRTVSTSAWNGDGEILETKDAPPQPREASVPALNEAVKAVCN